MAVSRETIAAIRFGYGFAARGRNPEPGALISALSDPDPALNDGGVRDTAETIAFSRAFSKARRARDTSGAAEEKFKTLRTEMRARSAADVRNLFQRAAFAKSSFRERLVRFWADHFTVAAQTPASAVLLAAYWDQAIRPNVTGRFADLLRAAVLHPAMLFYLDQNASIGPSTALAKRRGRGLNENLARELLELHTLGADAPYTQDDVRALAELLTGLRIEAGGTGFAPRRAEPGRFEILGRNYGGPKPTLGHIHAFLDDIAIHPASARHICRKLVAHFVSDAPLDDQVAQMTEVFLATDGDLGAVYAAMLDHPAAWQGFGAKVKQPFDLIVSATRALGMREEVFARLSGREVQRGLVLPMRLMGQPIGRPPGPDGWAEEAAAWITPQRLAGRVGWAMQVSQLTAGRLDPREFVETALRDAADDATKFAAASAEDRAEGIGLVLSSPAFNRR